MNNSNNKNESETIKFKKTQIEKYQKDNNCKSYQLIALLSKSTSPSKFETKIIILIYKINSYLFQNYL